MTDEGGRAVPPAGGGRRHASRPNFAGPRPSVRLRGSRRGEGVKATQTGLSGLAWATCRPSFHRADDPGGPRDAAPKPGLWHRYRDLPGLRRGSKDHRLYRRPGDREDSSLLAAKAAEPQALIRPPIRAPPQRGAVRQDGMTRLGRRRQRRGHGGRSPGGRAREKRAGEAIAGTDSGGVTPLRGDCRVAANAARRCRYR
jgi:hypothetical protein